MRHMPPAQGAEIVVGKEGVVDRRGLDPRGIVRVASEEWRATTADGALAPGRRARSWSPGSTVSCSPSMRTNERARRPARRRPRKGGTPDGRQPRAHRRDRDPAAGRAVPGQGDQGRARVPTAGRVPAGTPAGPEGPRARDPDPVRRQGDTSSTCASSTWRSRGRTRSRRTTRRSPSTSSCSTR